MHPASSGASILNVSSDGVIVSVARASRIAVDFDGTMDETDTGADYGGPPINTFCWFVDAALSPSKLRASDRLVTIDNESRGNRADRAARRLAMAASPSANPSPLVG